MRRMKAAYNAADLLGTIAVASLVAFIVAAVPYGVVVLIVEIAKALLE
jgi:hypothetical protein